MSDSFVTTWTVAHQASLSMEFSRQEYLSRMPFPSPGDLPDSEIKPSSPALAGGFFILLQLHASCFYTTQSQQLSPTMTITRSERDFTVTLLH